MTVEGRSGDTISNYSDPFINSGLGFTIVGLKVAILFGGIWEFGTCTLLRVRVEGC